MERFSEEDFTILLLYYMNNNGVESINKDELCKKLLGYKANEKYKNLFEKIGLTRGLDEYVDLYRSISSLKYSGELWYTSIDRNTLYININEKKLDSHFENKNETDLILLQEIAKQFGIRNKAEKLANGCLNIYGINPNQWYRLVDGNNLNRITWQLITDGLLEENILNTADNHVSWNNPNKKITVGYV